MSRLPVHQPPPGPIVAELMRAGLSLATVLAMEQWKAHEVLELLRGSSRAEGSGRPSGTTRGRI